MLALSHSVSPEITSITSVVASVSSQSVSSKNTSHTAPLQVFEGHEGDVNCACFYPDENKLVSGSWDHTLRIWDRNKGAIEVLRGHTDWVRDVDVSWDGRMVVSGSDDKTVRIWKGELGEMMRVFEGHKDYVKSVQFSADSRTVVSGSDDWTVRVWTVETGKLAFKPIKCFGFVDCARYSPSGDRIASGGFGIQVWDAKSGRGILSIRNSPVYSLAWTADGTQIIGGGQGIVTVWNSHNGEQLRTWPHWKAHDNISTIKLSLSPTGIHVATQDGQIQTVPSVFDILRKTAFVFDTSTGGQIAAFTHDGDVRGIIYSPSGQFIATACGDGKVYLWEAPAFEDPQPKSPASSFSSFLDRPAIPLARPSPNDTTGVDLFWDSSPEDPQDATCRDQQASSLPRQVLNRVRDMFSNLVTGHTARAAQNRPLTETVELIGVAAGKDKPYAATIDPPRFNRVQKILYTIIHCRKPDEEDEEIPAANTDTRPDSSQPPTGKPVIDTQPQRNEMITTRPSSAPCSMPATSKISAHVSPQPTPVIDPLSLAFASHEPSSSSAAVTSASLSASSNSSCPPSAHSSSHYADDLVTVVVSRAEWANLQDARRRSRATSALVTKAVDSLSRSEHEPASAVYPYHSTSLPRSPASVTQNTATIPHPSSPQPGSHLYAQPSRSLVGPDPFLRIVPSLLSSSFLLAPSRHSYLLQPPPLSNMQSPNLRLMGSSDDPVAETGAQLAIHRPANEDEVD